MKILTIKDENQFDLGNYSLACEGFVDALKSMFTGGGDREKKVAEMKSSKRPLELKKINEHLSRDLKVTYNNPNWVTKNLPEKTSLIKVPALSLANVNGKAITDPMEIIKVARSMVDVLSKIAENEKPFIELRRNLIVKIEHDIKNRQLPDKLWEQHSKQLETTAAQRWLKRDSKNYPVLGHSSGNSVWPVDLKYKGQSGFTTSYSGFKTSGEIQCPSRTNAKAYADAIEQIVVLLETVFKIIEATYISDWEGMGMDYDNLKHNDNVYNKITSSQSIEEVHDLAYSIEHKLRSIACGLYIAMFDKHPVE